MYAFVYPARFTPDEEDGGFVVSFRDLPEAITQGETDLEALHEARDCLEEAIANRIAMDLPIPAPSSPEPGEQRVALSARMAAKASLHIALHEESLTSDELARRLHCDEEAVRSLLDPAEPSKMPRLESALAAMGHQLVVGLQPLVCPPPGEPL